MILSRKRLQHFAAMVLIGDGILALIRPQHDALAWHFGPRPWQKLMKDLHDRPELTRSIGAAQVAFGIWWALQQEKGDD